MQSATSFALSQVLGVAAQRAITDMRKAVEAHVMRLPVRYFDSTKSGILISRIMTDAEGIRNLVGTGLVQLTGSIVTAVLLARRAVLPQLAADRASPCSCSARSAAGWRWPSSGCGRCSASAARSTPKSPGRLAETLGGVRIVKAYTAEKREELVFAKGAHRLFRNVAQVDDRRLGRVGVLRRSCSARSASSMMLVGGSSIRAGAMTIGDFVMYLFFTGAHGDAGGPARHRSARRSREAFAGLDRIREIRRMATEDDEDAGSRAARRRPRRGRVRRRDLRVQPGGAGAQARVVPRAGGIDDGARRVERVGQEHAHQPGHGVQPAAVRAACSWTAATSATVRLRDYRRHLGVVLQDNFLFDGTIAENIAYAQPHATREEIVAVSRIAHCDEFVEAFEKGYDTDRRRARRAAVGRPAPARGDRPRDPRGPDAS